MAARSATLGLSNVILAGIQTGDLCGVSLSPMVIRRRLPAQTVGTGVAVTVSGLTLTGGGGGKLQP